MDIDVCSWWVMEKEIRTRAETMCGNSGRETLLGLYWCFKHFCFCELNMRLFFFREIKGTWGHQPTHGQWTPCGISLVISEVTGQETSQGLLVASGNPSHGTTAHVWMVLRGQIVASGDLTLQQWPVASCSGFLPFLSLMKRESNTQHLFWW